MYRVAVGWKGNFEEGVDQYVQIKRHRCGVAIVCICSLRPASVPCRLRCQLRCLTFTPSPSISARHRLRSSSRPGSLRVHVRRCCACSCCKDLSRSITSKPRYWLHVTQATAERVRFRTSTYTRFPNAAVSKPGFQLLSTVLPLGIDRVRIE